MLYASAVPAGYSDIRICVTLTHWYRTLNRTHNSLQSVQFSIMAFSLFLSHSYFIAFDSHCHLFVFLFHFPSHSSTFHDILFYSAFEFHNFPIHCIPTSEQPTEQEMILFHRISSDERNKNVIKYSSFSSPVPIPRRTIMYSRGSMFV